MVEALNIGGRNYGFSRPFYEEQQSQEGLSDKLIIQKPLQELQKLRQPLIQAIRKLPMDSSIRKAFERVKHKGKKNKLP